MLTYQLEANRAMNLEDRLIHSLIGEKSGCLPSCRKKDHCYVLSQPIHDYFFGIKNLLYLRLKKEWMFIA
ncbi:hypothetical protein [Rickettsiella massiliensis]|uniref:hypothetical protein n=1 Tax=Rickettsiella massiliensis TaxID=676517 RepID=UPI00029A4CE7|nr:hypothetical protein [Rickettsiella massiliensis]